MATTALLIALQVAIVVVSVGIRSVAIHHQVLTDALIDARNFPWMALVS